MNCQACESTKRNYQWYIVQEVFEISMSINLKHKYRSLLSWMQKQVILSFILHHQDEKRIKSITFIAKSFFSSMRGKKWAMLGRKTKHRLCLTFRTAAFCWRLLLLGIDAHHWDELSAHRLRGRCLPDWSENYASRSDAQCGHFTASICISDLQ